MKKISLFLFLILFSSYSFAVKIIKVKDNKILLDLDTDEASINQKIYFLNASAKKIGIATITQIKNGKAIAVLNKGKADGAETVQLIAIVITDTPEADTTETTSTSSEAVTYRLSGIKFSGLLTYGMNNMSTKQTDGILPTPNEETVTLKGSSIGITAALDYPFNDFLTLRTTLGYEPFVASGTSRFTSCDNITSTNCTANLNYLAAGGYVRIDLIKSRYLTWVGLGISGKMPISKTTTALRADDIKATYTYAATMGLDYFVGNKNFIPVSLEYQLFLSSDTVSANAILFRAGYGWAF